jgi:hypothetical protein
MPKDIRLKARNGGGVPSPLAFSLGAFSSLSVTDAPWGVWLAVGLFVITLWTGYYFQIKESEFISLEDLLNRIDELEKQIAAK